MKLSKEALEKQLSYIDMTKYKLKDGKMKKYLIQCPYCSRLEKSNKQLNDLGIVVLHENEYIYQRCSHCQDKVAKEHEKETTTITERRC